LTNINSAIRGNGGMEKSLPGVHSDIGGGYVDGATESVRLDYSGYLPSLRKERTHLIEQGWYRPSEIVVDEFWGTLIGTRVDLCNRYSFVPLHIMTEYAICKLVKFTMGKITGDYPIPGVLAPVKARLDQYVVGGGKGPMSYNDPADKKMLEWLRNRYCHFSAHYNGWLVPHKPNRIDSVRTRVIQDG